jgi:hypothetical protein
MVNLAKYSMVFGSKCSDQERRKVLEILHVSNTTMEGKYLWLPTTEGRMTKEKFKMTKEKLVNRCNFWAERHMSMGAKEVLVKFVAQAIPTYTMGMFKLPSSTCEVSSESSGGERRMANARFIGSLGTSSWLQKEEEGWGLVI